MSGRDRISLPLPTETQNLATVNLDMLSSLELVTAIHTADLEAVEAVQAELPQIALAIDKVTERIRAGGRLFYLGAGTSGRLGVLDAAECPPTYSSAPELVQGVIAGGYRALQHAVEGAEDSVAQGVDDLKERSFRPADTLVGIAASGRTPYVLGGMAYARGLGAWTLALSCAPGSALASAAHLAITLRTGPEVVTGSTRMKAGTATKLVLNMLSTGVMVKLGYVYGNLMVNVQPTNEKLQDRSARLVQQLTGLSRQEAVTLLRESGSVRVAVIMHRLQIDRSTAEARLQAAGGRLREVIG